MKARRFNPKKHKEDRRRAGEARQPVEVRYRRGDDIGPAVNYDMTQAIQVRPGVELVARVTIVADPAIVPPEASRLAGEFLAGGSSRVLGIGVQGVRTAKPVDTGNEIAGPMTLSREAVLRLFADGGAILHRIAVGGNPVYQRGDLRYVREEFILAEDLKTSPGLLEEAGAIADPTSGVVFAADCADPSKIGGWLPAAALPMQASRALVRIDRVMPDAAAPDKGPDARWFTYHLILADSRVRPPEAVIRAGVPNRTLRAVPRANDPVVAPTVEAHEGPFHYVLRVDGEPIGVAPSAEDLAAGAYQTMRQILEDQEGVADSPDSARSFRDAIESLDQACEDFSAMVEIMLNAVGWLYSAEKVPGLIGSGETSMAVIPEPERAPVLETAVGCVAAVLGVPQPAAKHTPDRSDCPECGSEWDAETGCVNIDCPECHVAAPALQVVGTMSDDACEKVREYVAAAKDGSTFVPFEIEQPTLPAGDPPAKKKYKSGAQKRREKAEREAAARGDRD